MKTCYNLVLRGDNKLFNYKSKDDNKDDRIVIRLTKEEKDFLKAYWKDNEITVSQYVYNLICVDLSNDKNR